MMDTLRIGIIGFGNMGTFHARYLSQGEVAGATLGAICDTDPERVKLARETYGKDLPLFDSAEALFAAKVVDAVIVATPHYFPPPIAVQGFANGCHVLVEKPAGVYTKQVREMIEAAAKSGCVFGVMFNQRCRPYHQKVKDIVQSGELGDIRRVVYVITDWFRPQAYYNSGGWRATWGGEGGGVLANQCPHNLDLWQWICGMPTRVRAFCDFGKFHDIEVEDDVTAYVEYANGATGVFMTTTGEAPGCNRLEISGDRGRLTLEGGKISFQRTRESVSKFLKENPNMFASPETWKCEVPTFGDGEEHIGITKNWVNSILTGAPLLARGEEGINGVQLANAMLLSAWTDDWVNLPIDEDLYYSMLQEKINSSTYKKQVVEVKPVELNGTF